MPLIPALPGGAAGRVGVEEGRVLAAALFSKRGVGFRQNPDNSAVTSRHAQTLSWAPRGPEGSTRADRASGGASAGPWRYWAGRWDWASPAAAWAVGGAPFPAELPGAVLGVSSKELMGPQIPTHWPFSNTWRGRVVP